MATRSLACRILRNSWTASWGEKGYMRIAMSGPDGPKQGLCCVMCQSSYPTVTKAAAGP